MQNEFGYSAESATEALRKLVETWRNLTPSDYDMWRNISDTLNDLNALYSKPVPVEPSEPTVNFTELYRGQNNAG